MKAITVVRQRPGASRAIPAHQLREILQPLTDDVGCVLNVALPEPSLGNGAGRTDPVGAVIEWEGTEKVVREAATAVARAEEYSISMSYVVDVSVPQRYERTWPVGEPSPGIRMMSLCHRAPQLSRDEFARYWRDEHTAVAMGFTVPIWNYTQTVVKEPISSGAPTLDGVAGLHFHSLAAWQARYLDYPDEARAGAEDAARFMDVPQTEAFFAQETILSIAPAGAHQEGGVR